MVVQSGTVQTCTTANSPVSGYKKGDKYIDLVLANADNSHIYILVSDLIDTYTQGTGIVINNNQVSVDSSVVALKSDLTSKANTSDLATVATSGSYNDLEDKPTIPTVPTSLSGFTDDLGSNPTHTHSQYLTSHQDISGKANTSDVYTKTQIDNMNLITYVELA